MSKSFIKIITARMKEKNIGVRKLARQCGIDASFISKVIQGKRNPPGDEKTIKKIASALSIDPIMLTIYTGKIPVSLQPVFEELSFIKNLAKNQPLPYEHTETPQQKPPKSFSKKSSLIKQSKSQIPRTKIYPPSDIADELL